MPTTAKREMLDHVLVGEPLLVTVTGLHWQRGLEHALGALHLVRSGGTGVRWLLVGDGPAREQVVYTIDDLGLGPAVTLVRSPGRRARRLAAWADAQLDPTVHGPATAVPAWATRPTRLEVGGPAIPAWDTVALAAAITAWATELSRDRPGVPALP